MLSSSFDSWQILWCKRLVLVWRVKMPNLLLYFGWRTGNLDIQYPAWKPEVSVEGYFLHWKLSINGTLWKQWILLIMVEYSTLISLQMGIVFKFCLCFIQKITVKFRWSYKQTTGVGNSLFIVHSKACFIGGIFFFSIYQ